MDLTKEQKYIILALIGILISGLIYGIYNHFNQAEEIEILDVSPSLVKTSEGMPLLVHLSGAVLNQGVFKLKPGSRIVDAVNAAGGALPDADLAAVNLAQEIKDGIKILIPFKKKPGGIAQAGPSGTSSNGSININSANDSELQKIPGVGKVTAGRIIDYRKTSGGFSSVDDLTKVKGIGKKTLEKIREYVTVN